MIKKISFLSLVLNIAHIPNRKLAKKTTKVELTAAQKQNHLLIFQTSTSQYLHTSILALFGRSGKFYWSFLFHLGDFHCSCLMKATARLSSSSSSQSTRLSLFLPKGFQSFFLNIAKVPGNQMQAEMLPEFRGRSELDSLTLTCSALGKWRCVRLQPLRYPESQLCCLPLLLVDQGGETGQTHGSLVGWLVCLFVCWR